MGVKLNSKGVYVCAICGKECGDSVRSLSAHVTHVHTIKSKDYYDKYVRLEGEGKCPICGNPTRFRDIVDGYKVCCSKKCAGQYIFNDPEKAAEIAARREVTSMARYGVKNGGGSQQALEKARQTNLEKRGVLYPTQSKEVIEKSKATCLAKYDATTFVHSETGKQAVGDTNEQKYGNREFFASEAGKSAVNEGHLRNHGYIRSSMKPGEGKRIADHYRETHGGIHFTQTPEWKEKMHATQVDRYGTWYSASEEGRRLYREQMMTLFNVPEYFQSDEFKEKSKKTLMETRGVEFISQSDEWKQKVTDTSMREYGVPHFTQSEEIKAAYRETCMENWGVPNFAQTDEWKERSRNTNMEHWGSPHYAQSDAFRNKVLGEYKELMSPYSCTPVKFHSPTEVEYVCNVCGHTCLEQSQLIKFRVISKLSPCTNCVPKNRPISVEEDEVRRFVESLGFATEHYDRDFLDSYGADIVIPSKNLIIEYDGLYWHSELYKAPNYHVMKRIIAEQKGYHLIHLFSDEWQLHQKVVESRLKKLLGIGCEKRIYARDCEVREIAESDSAVFIDNNHLQGNVKAAFRYGLFHKDRLVSVMTFRESRFERGVTEMLRFCSDRDMNIVGAAGKLFSHFVAEHQDVLMVVSYADARWTPSTGAFYPKLGFEYVGLSAPGYYIVDGDIRRNRMNYQRHKIAGPGDEGKTEHDITLERGLYRIYDCGQLKYVWMRHK